MRSRRARPVAVSTDDIEQKPSAAPPTEIRAGFGLATHHDTPLRT